MLNRIFVNLLISLPDFSLLAESDNRNYVLLIQI